MTRRFRILLVAGQAYRRREMHGIASTDGLIEDQPK